MPPRLPRQRQRPRRAAGLPKAHHAAPRRGLDPAREPNAGARQGLRGAGQHAGAAYQRPGLGRLAREILDHSEYPRERYREGNGLTHLTDQYGVERVEAAARRALHYGTFSDRDVKAILESGADRMELEGGEQAGPSRAHKNVRGPEYYEGSGSVREEGAC